MLSTLLGVIPDCSPLYLATNPSVHLLGFSSACIQTLTTSHPSIATILDENLQVLNTPQGSPCFRSCPLQHIPYPASKKFTNTHNSAVRGYLFSFVLYVDCLLPHRASVTQSPPPLRLPSSLAPGTFTPTEPATCQDLRLSGPHHLAAAWLIPSALLSGVPSHVPLRPGTADHSL